MTHSDFMPAVRPRLSDIRSCDDWLAHAPLGDSRQACKAFLLLLDELEDEPPRHAVYLQILERLREPVLSALEEHAKRYAGKALPLAQFEALAFTQASDVWIALLRAYRRLLRAGITDRRPELRPSLPRICHRAIDCAGELITVSLLARREVGTELWGWLYEMYRFSDAEGLASESVSDGKGESSCTTALIRPLMFALAEPYGLASRELAWVWRWVKRWSSKVQLTDDGAPGYCVDLSGHGGAVWNSGERSGPSMRRLDLSEVGHSIRTRLRRLEEGINAPDLGLGRDCSQPAAAELLTTLAQAWLEPPRIREFPRRSSSTSTRVVTGFVTIHQAVGGRLPERPEASPFGYSHRVGEQIQVFQRALDVAPRGATSHSESTGDSWASLDESATGFRLQRKGKLGPVSLRQLLALRPEGGHKFILSDVRWLCQGEDNVTIGTRALPGLARACDVHAVPRPVGHAGPAAASTGAFLLPVAEGVPPSLVLPSGWYQNGRVLELQVDDAVRRIKLFGVLTHGFDYDLVNFSAA